MPMSATEQAWTITQVRSDRCIRHGTRKGSLTSPANPAAPEAQMPALRARELRALHAMCPECCLQ
jgi:hypothetical protein